MVSENVEQFFDAQLTARLNPYCSGIWSRRVISLRYVKNPNFGLILIVVEYGLGVRDIEGNQCLSPGLILIVVEYGLGVVVQ